MIPNSSVLIVDRSAESREVLRTALERRGLRILEAARCEEGLSLAKLHQPDLIVLDLETDSTGPVSADEFAEVADHAGGTLIVLTSAPRGDHAATGQFVAKPYHYGPLILRIEELLRQRSSRKAA